MIFVGFIGHKIKLNLASIGYCMTFVAVRLRLLRVWFKTWPLVPGCGGRLPSRFSGRIGQERGVNAKHEYCAHMSACVPKP